MKGLTRLAMVFSLAIVVIWALPHLKAWHKGPRTLAKFELVPTANQLQQAVANAAAQANVLAARIKEEVEAGSDRPTTSPLLLEFVQQLEQINSSFAALQKGWEALPPLPQPTSAPSSAPAVP